MKSIPFGFGRWIVGVLALCTSSTAQEAQSDLENAALSYWQAFAVLPELTEEQDKLVSQWERADLDDATLALIDQASGALSLLHRGATIPQCYWGSALEEGPGALLPHLSKTRLLARVACLRARYHFQQGKTSAAWQDVKDCLVLSRHVGAEQLLISYLVQLAIERIAMSAVLPELPHLPQADLAEILTELKSLPPRATVAQGIEGERRWMLGWIRRQLMESAQQDDKQQMEFIKALLGDTPETQQVVALFGQEPGAAKRALAMCDELGSYYDRMIKALGATVAEQQEEWEKLDQVIEAGDNPLAKLLLPAIGSVAAAEREAQTRWAMYLAAVDITHGGPDALQNHRDPAGDGPFELKQLTNGFELRSKLIHKDQPVVITVGTGE